MSIEYYVSFEPVLLTREELLEPVLEILYEMDAKIDTSFDRLEFKNGKFQYTYEDINYPSLISIFELTKNWDGIQINFVCTEKLCNLIIINDDKSSNTLILSEPGSLFEWQWFEQSNYVQLVNRLINSMKILGANFCILEPGWTQRSRTQKDIEKWLFDLGQGIKRDWELVIIKNETLSESIPDFTKTDYHLKILKEKELLMISKSPFKDVLF
ncbi:hypothetical protein THII_0994 [Thioploca ingrica]|uniref:Uncharacterized protein n=1 Tax=Thioploca ingrica TaxID=40754 RepID=A0A090BUL0_9GAMM|nr:hypothetical protein THII_0994 [Thioploca ingrica]